MVPHKTLGTFYKSIINKLYFCSHNMMKSTTNLFKNSKDPKIFFFNFIWSLLAKITSSDKLINWKCVLTINLSYLRCGISKIWHALIDFLYHGKMTATLKNAAKCDVCAVVQCLLLTIQQQLSLGKFWLSMDQWFWANKLYAVGFVHFGWAVWFGCGWANKYLWQRKEWPDISRQYYC